jgi:hypothetical protein
MRMPSASILIEVYKESFPNCLSVFHDKHRHRHQNNGSTGQDRTSPPIPQLVIHRCPKEGESCSDHGAEERTAGNGRRSVSGKRIDKEVLSGIKDADCSNAEKDRSLTKN